MRWFIRSSVLVGLLVGSFGAAHAMPAHSVAREWNEQNLAAIRVDFPDPTQHARNLFHVSAAMWDAWAVYDATATGYVHREKLTSNDVEAARHEAISYAAYRVLVHRYQSSEGSVATLAALDQQMTDLGYPTAVTTTVGNDPSAVGNRVAAAVITFALTDASNEQNDYEDLTYAAVNQPLLVDRLGVAPHSTMTDRNRWQPLAFDFAFTQNGLVAEQIQTFLGSNWGVTRPFAMRREEGETVYFDPGAPPMLGGAEDAEFKTGSVAVIEYSRLLDPDETPSIDVSPGAIGNNTLGLNDGTGRATNPVTGSPYASNMVNHADFGRVVAEFWADGPDSETPPGHWNGLANEVADHPLFVKQMRGTGPVLSDLEWDVKMYFALNGALHDAAVAAWSCKRAYDYVRPISSIREMCHLGQSTDSLGPSYHASGIPLVPGFIEVITAQSSAMGERHEHLSGDVGKIALYCWGGEPDDPETQYTGNEWILGIDWLPYQRDTFVTPAFAGYISGHSTFSRAAAEVLTAMTGSEFFPGGLGSYTVPVDGLEFEAGPSTAVTLQWATYYDAADQAGLSRLYGGIHVPVDDGPGRVVGSNCGMQAWDLAQLYFDGSVDSAPIVVELKKDAGQMELRWEQLPGLYYQVESSQTMSSWSIDQPFARAEDQQGEQSFSAGARGFFKVTSALEAPAP